MQGTIDYAPTDAPTPRRPIWELLFIALPTIAQMASYTVAQFIDTYMLSHSSDVEATAAGQAGLISFTVISFGFGVMMLVNALVSQSAGRGDLPACGQFMWQGVWSGLLLGACCVPVAFLGGPLFRALGHPAELARHEAAFFTTTVAFAAFKLCGMALEQFMLAVQRPNVVLLAAVAGVCCMIPFNYTFIYGHFGMPRLGVVGAAWGLNLAVIVEGGIVAAVIAFTGVGRKYGCGDWRLRWDKLRTLLVTGIPSGVQVVAEVAAWSMFTAWVIGAFFPQPVLAANVYTFRYMSVSFMPAFGLSTAVTALVGRYIGMGKPDVAAARAHLGFKVAAVYMMLCGVFFFAFRKQLIGLFSHDPAVIEAGGILLLLAGVYQFFDAMYIVYNGALRGAGDTFVPAVTVGSLCWTMTVGGGALMAWQFGPRMGVLAPWLAAAAYGVVVGLFLMLRFTRGRWRAIRLDRGDASANVPNLDPATAAASA
ncbi:MAG TPA: MATE family efflux transporter [Humisphaera sp.]